MCEGLCGLWNLLQNVPLQGLHVKALNNFCVYILHSHAVDYVPNAAVKDILTQSDLYGR